MDDVEWVDYDNDGKRVVPVLRVSTSLDALLEGLHDAGITDSGESLSAATVRRLACDAEIIPTVLNGKGRVIDVGRRTRRVSEALRCVLVARDGGCVWPGCDAPPSRCDAHHVEHWADGGPTNADNLALLCHRHHILLHEGRHRLERAGDAWVVLKPDGTRLHTPLAAARADIGPGHLGADDSIPSHQPGPDALCDLVTTANTDRTAATTLGHPREPSTGLVTAANPDATTAISDVDPALRPTNGAAPTPARQLTLACGGRNEFTMRLTATSLSHNKVQAGPAVGRNEFTMRLTATSLSHDKVQAGPRVGYSDSRSASQALTAPPANRGSGPVSPANQGSGPRPPPRSPPRPAGP